MDNQSRVINDAEGETVRESVRETCARANTGVHAPSMWYTSQRDGHERMTRSGKERGTQSRQSADKSEHGGGEDCLSFSSSLLQGNNGKGRNAQNTRLLGGVGFISPRERARLCASRAYATYRVYIYSISKCFLHLSSHCLALTLTHGCGIGDNGFERRLRLRETRTISIHR